MMKAKLFTLTLFAIVLLFSACLKDDHFGKSKYNTLYNYVLEGQIGDASVNQTTGIVSCSMDSTADITSLALVNYQVSNYATINPGIGDVVDYSDTVDIIVTAENGDPQTYKIVLQEPKQNEQLANSGFQQWYDTGNDYLEPGTDKDNVVWSTGNAGSVLAGNIATYPDVIGSNDSIAVLETKAVAIGPRIAAGSLFTGIFKLNLSNIPASIIPGIPFNSRPAKFQLDMIYNPGAENLDGNGDPVSHPDEADIYVLLEVWNGDEKQRLATAWYRSSDEYTDWNTLVVDFTYGPLDGSFPDYMKPADGLYADPNAIPTHISVIFSSSAGGAVFEGAVGSILKVNNFALVY